MPPAKVPAATGTVHVRASTIVVETAKRVQLIDLTDRAVSLIESWGMTEGLLVISPLHTTCAVIVNEFQLALADDVMAFLERLAPRENPWTHNDPVRSDCDRKNGDSHLRALLLGSGATLQVSGGFPVLGMWQRVILAELDGPRARQVRIQAWDLRGADRA